MMRLIVFMAIAYVGYTYFKKRNAKLLKVVTKIKEAFAETNDETVVSEKVDSSKDMANDIESSAIPDNIRKDILSNQYMMFFEHKESVSDETKKPDVAEIEDEALDEDQSHALSNVNARTVFADKNGEIHSMYDLISAPVNQADESERKYSYDSKKSKYRETYRKHQNEASDSAESLKATEIKPEVEQAKQEMEIPMQADDLFNQVKARLASRK